MFVDADEEGRELLERLKEHGEEFRRGAYNCSYPNPEIREGDVPSTRSGTTAAIVVRRLDGAGEGATGEYGSSLLRDVG